MAGENPPSAPDPSQPIPQPVWDPVYRVTIRARVEWRGPDGRYAKQWHRDYGAQLTLADLLRDRGAA